MNLKEAKKKKQAQIEAMRSAQQQDDETTMTAPAAKDDQAAASQRSPENEQNRKGENKMEEKVRDGIEKIRPFLQRDGGDIEFVGLTEDNVVEVRLLGHCQGCPHRQATINGMVYQVLHEAYPEVAGVVAVD